MSALLFFSIMYFANTNKQVNLTKTYKIITLFIGKCNYSASLQKTKILLGSGTLDNKFHLWNW